MVHGDLKGANVLVCETGIPKLADFGNMKMKEQSLKFTTRTSTVYSLRWAAPELLDQSPVSAQADVYALGMETVTGRVPYAGKTDRAVVMDIMIHERLPDWDDSLVNTWNQETFRGLLGRCWSRVSSSRPRAAEIEFQFANEELEDEPNAREICAWSRCDHENVLRLLGLVQYRGRLATISLWMENGTLPEYVVENPSVDWLELCRQVAKGLAYLHEHGIVHGDLKGANVLVSETGIPKLAGFGSTKLREQIMRDTPGTRPVYSWQWAAPELFNHSPVSPETDAYALGMVS
ncbi:hypothetical protein FRC09_002785 [Ceratobasidium sp. 395]|nr:hypothetical protein FRC09_002785 [Ceratobasidium sp. 395]